MKKLTALLVSLAMVFTMLPMAAIAEGDENAAVPEDAEEISAGSFGFDGPEIFDESLTNPGVELGGDEDQDETTPETDEDAPSEAETEEPSEEPTEAETEPEVEPDNGVSDEEVEAFKEYVYSLGERELEEANVIELFLALGIISEDSEMTNAKYYQYVLDNGFDNMADLVDAAIVWKVLYLRENDPDWPFEPVQSDPGIIEGPGYEGMPNTETVSAAEIDAMFQLMALTPKNKKLTITLTGVSDGDTITMTVPSDNDGQIFKEETTWATEPNRISRVLKDSVSIENPTGAFTIELSGEDATDYEVSSVTYNGEPVGSAAEEGTKVSVTIDADTFTNILEHVLTNTATGGEITITVSKKPPKTVSVTVKENGGEGFPRKATYNLTGLKQGTETKSGIASQFSGVTAYVGDTLHFSVSTESAFIKSVEITGKGTEGSGTTDAEYTVQEGDAENDITIKVTFKPKASLSSVSVTIDEVGNKSFTDGIASVTVSGNSSLEGKNISESASEQGSLGTLIGRFLEGDTITLTVTPKTPEGGGTYRLTTFSGGSSGSVVPETGTVSNVSLGTSMTFTFTFMTVKDAPTLTVSQSSTASGAVVTFTFVNYNSYSSDPLLTSGDKAYVSANPSTYTSLQKPESVNNREVSIIGSPDGVFGVNFTPKNKNKGFSFNYSYRVDGRVTYDGSPITEGTNIDIGPNS